MKIKHLSLFLVMVAGIVFISGSCSSTKKTTASKPASTAAPVATVAQASTYEGTWNYSIAGTPDGDFKGDMVITKEADAYKGTIEASGQKVNINQFIIKDNALSGNFEYNGMLVNITGTFAGNDLTGKVEAQGYAFPLTAKKKI